MITKEEFIIRLDNGRDFEFWYGDDGRTVDDTKVKVYKEQDKYIMSFWCPVGEISFEPDTITCDPADAAAVDEFYNHLTYYYNRF